MSTVNQDAIVAFRISFAIRRSARATWVMSPIRAFMASAWITVSHGATDKGEVEPFSLRRSRLPVVLAVLLPIVSGLTYVVWHRVTANGYCKVGPAAAPEDYSPYRILFLIGPLALTLIVALATRQSLRALATQTLLAIGATIAMFIVAFFLALVTTGVNCNGT